MRTLDEKEVAVLTLLASDPARFKAQALTYLKGRFEALAIARAILGEATADPDVAEAVETIRSWTQQPRRTPVAA